MLHIFILRVGSWLIRNEHRMHIIIGIWARVTVATVAASVCVCWAACCLPAIRFYKRITCKLNQFHAFSTRSSRTHETIILNKLSDSVSHYVPQLGDMPMRKSMATLLCLTWRKEERIRARNVNVIFAFAKFKIVRFHLSALCSLTFGSFDPPLWFNFKIVQFMA